MEHGNLRKKKNWRFVAHLDFYLMVATLVKDATLFYIDELLRATFRHDLIK